MEDFANFAKGFMPIFVVESQWLKCLVMHQNLWNVFLNQKQIIQQAIPTFVVETMDHYMMPTLIILLRQLLFLLIGGCLI